MKKVFMALLLAGCTTQPALRETAQIEKYDTLCTVGQLDSICKADTLPYLYAWDSLYVRSMGYIYFYRDGKKTYRVYRVKDNKFDVTKRVDK